MRRWIVCAAAAVAVLPGTTTAAATAWAFMTGRGGVDWLTVVMSVFQAGVMIALALAVLRIIDRPSGTPIWLWDRRVLQRRRLHARRLHR